FVTGAAGFIGSQLVDHLLDSGNHVSGVDDLSLGRKKNLNYAQKNGRFIFFERDVSRTDHALESLRQASAWSGNPDRIRHLAAHSDIAAGSEEPGVDFRRTLQTTFAT